MTDSRPAVLGGRPWRPVEWPPGSASCSRRVTACAWRAPLWRPTSTTGKRGGRKVPTIIYPHGGPTWQAYRIFAPLRLLLAKEGYAFLDVDFRGSTGYGRAFRAGQPRRMGPRRRVRHDRRRPRHVLHDHWLDDVELARVGPGVGRDRSPLRRLAVPAGAERAVRRRRRGTAHLARRLRQVHRFGRQDGHRADEHTRLPRAAHDLLHRLAPLVGWVSRGVRPHQGRRAPGFHRGRHRPVRMSRGRRPHRTGVRGRDPTTRARDGRRRRRRRRHVTPRLARCGRRARVPRTVPVDAARLLGRHRGERYHAAYFARFPEVWAHGDFASWTEHGGMVIHGRSDATLNPGGVRIGTAEIYRVVESMPEVLEALAFGQQWHNDVRIVLLVRLVDGVSLTDDLVAKIPHGPRRVLAATHARGRRRGRRPSAHTEQQAGRAGGGRRGARPAGAQRRGAREP